MALDAAAGLMYYGARYYDPALGRFISADTIVPSAANPQALNRYAYVLNNPVKYTDPTGHVESCGMEVCSGRGAITRELPGWREAGAAYEEYMRAKHPSDPSQFNPDLVDAHWRAFQGMYTETRNSMPWSHWTADQWDAVQNDWADAALLGVPGSTPIIDAAFRGVMGALGGTTAKTTGTPNLLPNENPDADITIIGSRRDTRRIATTFPGEVNYLDIPDEMWTPEVNRSWLLRAYNRGNELWLVTAPGDLRINSWTWEELWDAKLLGWQIHRMY